MLVLLYSKDEIFWSGTNVFNTKFKKKKKEKKIGILEDD